MIPIRVAGIAALAIAIAASSRPQAAAVDLAAGTHARTVGLDLVGKMSDLADATLLLYAHASRTVPPPTRRFP